MSESESRDLNLTERMIVPICGVGTGKMVQLWQRNSDAVAEFVPPHGATRKELATVLDQHTPFPQNQQYQRVYTLVRGRLAVEGSCWVYTGYRGRGGYGRMRRGGVLRYVHVAVYEALNGSLPEGHEVDHVRSSGCTSRACCNPAHLEAVTHRVNTLRGSGPTAVNATKTHCIHGHELTGDNLMISARGYRKCRTCHRRLTNAYKARRRAA